MSRHPWSALAARALLAVALASFVTSCSRKAEAPTPLPPSSAPEPSFDVAKVIRQTHFAFAKDGDRYVGGEPIYAVEADAAGFHVAPRHYAPSGRVDGAPLSLGRTWVAHGEGSFALSDGSLERAKDGTLLRRAGAVTERLRNHEEGVDQTWELSAKPQVSGPLRLRIPVSGLSFVATTSTGLHFKDEVSGLGVRYSHATFVDARGVKTAVPAKYVDGAIELAVSEELLSKASYPAVLDPTVSPEFMLDQPVTGSKSYDAQFTPAIAFDGTNYFVAWTDRRAKTGFNYELYGARVTTSGDLIDLEGFIISTGQAQTDHAAVAFGGGNYFVVWDDNRNGSTDIYGARVTPAGTVLDPSGIAISTAANSQYSPTLAFDGTNFMVVWSDQRTSINTDLYGARVSTTGAVLDANGFVVVSQLNYQDMADIVWTGSQYYVVWADSRAGSGYYDLYGARVTAAGSVLDTGGVVISAAAQHQQYPAVAVSSTDMLVVWADGSPNRIMGRRMNLNGTFIDPSPFQISENSTDLHDRPDVIFTGSHWLVAWDVGFYTNDVYAARVSASGAVMDTTPILVSALDRGQSQVALATDGVNVFVAYSDYYGDSNGGLSGARIDPSGLVLDANGKVLDLSANDMANATVAYANGTYLVAWSDDRSAAPGPGIYATRVDPAGNVLDAAAFKVSPASVQFQTYPVLHASSDGTNFLVAWVQGDMSSAARQVVAKRISTAGALLDPNPIAISPNTAVADFAVAYGGGQYLIAWEDDRGPNSTFDDVYAGRLTSAGVLLDGTGIPVSVDVSNTSNLAAASDGTNFLLAWADRRNSTNDIYGARVNAAGTVLDPAGIALVTSAAPSNIAAPFLTYGSNTYLLTWDTTVYSPAPTTTTTYARRFNTSGVLQGSTLTVATLANPACVLRALAFDGTNFIAAGNSGTSTASLFAVRIAPDGTLLDAPPFTAPTILYGNGGAIASDGAGRSLIAFSYAPSNGSQFTTRVMARMLITKPNSPPVATGQSLTTAEDTPLSITLAGTDADPDTLTYAIVGQPANGTLSGTPPNVTYTPAANFAGTDSFTFRAYDGTQVSASASVSITVTPVNDAPTAANQAISVRQSTARSFVLAGADVDSSSLTYTVLTTPLNGTLSGTAPNLTFTPAAGYTGTASFTWKVSDGALDSPTATVTFTVSAQSAPVANAQSLTTAEDTPVNAVLTASDSNGDPLTFTIVAQPSNGVLQGTAPNLIYRPSVNFVGSDSFSFKVNDGAVDSATATVSIAVSAVNDRPVALSASATVVEDTPTAITLTGSDVEGATLTYAIASQPGRGTVTGTPPNVTYTPTLNAVGADFFTFTVSDGTNTSNPGTIFINVTQVNDPPIASDVTRTTNEDVATNIAFNAYDPEGDTFTYSVVTQPANGTVTGTGSNRTYTPASNWSGTDSFTYKATDATGDSNVATVTITVNPVNDAPVATGQSATVQEDSFVDLTLSGTDVEGSSLTYAVTIQPTKGTLSGTPPNLRYTPNPNVYGFDQFYFTVNDGTATSGNGIVQIGISNVNDPPTVADMARSGNEDTNITVTFTATDIDSSSFTYIIVTPPANGTLTGTGSTRTYRANADWNGTDTFTYKANDGSADSNVATVTVTVNPVNDAPRPDAQNVTCVEDSSVAITLTATDPEGSPMTYTIDVAPTKGLLTGTPPNITYTPNANVSGSDFFWFKVSDGTLTSGAVLVQIGITPVNDPPVALDVTRTTNEDTSVSVAFSATDPENNSLTYTVVTTPANGTLSGSGSTRTYVPAPEWSGIDSFTYMATDSQGADSNVATVTITVNNVNDPPVGQSKTVVTNEDTAVSFTLTGTDAEGATLTFTVTQQPTKGVLSGNVPDLTYTPNPNTNGFDTVRFVVNDGTQNSAAATITLNVAAQPDPPVAGPVTATTLEDTSVVVTLACTDPDGTTGLTASLVTQPSNGTVNTVGGYRYTPATNFNGTDSFTYRCSDGTNLSNVETVTITVTPIDDRPVANAQTIATPLNTARTFTLTGTDPEGATLTFTVVTNPTKGTLSGTAPDLTYTPNTGATGADSFTFKVNDGAQDSLNATVSINITNGGNTAPTAGNVTATTAEDAAGAITLLGADVDGNPLTYTIVTQPTNGTLSGTGASRTYSPNTNYNGSDSFTYKVNDGTVDSNTATVSITVTAVNDAPVANALTVSLPPAGGAVTLTATDVENSTLTYSVVTQPANGTLTGAAPNLTFTPATGFSGATSFTFKANDGSLDSNVATVTLNVSGNTPPTITASASLLSPLEGQNVAFTATAADADGDTLTFGWTFGDGATADQRDVTHAYAEQGTFTATVTVSDGAATASATVTINVQNASPVLVPATDAVSAEEATDVSFTANVSDPGATDTLTVSWDFGDGSPAQTGASVSHTFADDGAYTVTVTVTDDDGASTTGTRAVTVTNVAPVPTQQGLVKIDVGSEGSAQLQATDRAGAADPLSWSLVEGPGAIAADGKWTWTPGESDVGRHVVKVKVSDDDDGVAESVFDVEVAGADNSAAVGGTCGCNASGGAMVLLALAALALARRRSGT